jgi:hypothetical protein
LKEDILKKMEGDSIYEESRAELQEILKHLSTDSVTINMSKLDGNTRNDLTSVIQKVIYERLRSIDKVILGAK